MITNFNIFENNAENLDLINDILAVDYKKYYFKI